jgi:hypothetical protein
MISKHVHPVTLNASLTEPSGINMLVLLVVWYEVKTNRAEVR